jgi:cytochrome P450
MLLPAFSYRHIKELYSTFWHKGSEVTDAMTDAIRRAPSAANPDPTIVNAGEWASRVTLDIIGVAGMGQDFNAIRDPTSELNQCYRDVFQPSGAARRAQLLSFFIPAWILTKLPLKRNRQVLEARQTIRRICGELIAKKKTTTSEEKPGTDILSVAMATGGFSDEDLIDQMMTFLAAGHETTASAMSWACYHLCRHPHIQTRLRSAIRAHLPSISADTAIPSAADLDAVAYLHAFCNEVLRLYPSVPLTIRIAANDSTILGHVIPKDTTIIISPWATNASVQLWGPDAADFNPDRWMAPGCANSGGADSNYSFLTFIHGPRSCIGQAFAKAEFAALVAAWVGRFEISFADPEYVLEIGGGITSKPKGGLMVKLGVVEGW